MPSSLARPNSSQACSAAERAKAFTLIELLVVISIISILAMLLLPAIGLIKKSAIRSRCASNCRQIVLATVAYANDFEGILPTRDPAGAYWPMWLFSGTSYNLNNSLFSSYIEEESARKVMFCPGRLSDANAVGSYSDPNGPNCIALLRAAARLTPSPPSAPMRRGLKQRLLDMALGDLLSDTRSGRSNPDQRLDVHPRTGDLVDRGASVALVMWFMTSCGDGDLHRCLGAPEMS